MGLRLFCAMTFRADASASLNSPSLRCACDNRYSVRGSGVRAAPAISASAVRAFSMFARPPTFISADAYRIFIA